MTDTLPTTTTTEPDQPGSNFGQALNATLKAAPELGTSPGLSVGVASGGGDVAGNAQAVARGTQAISHQRALNDVSQVTGGGNALTDALNWFGEKVSSTVGHYGSDVIHAGEQAGAKVLTTLNKPMQFVQHEYRYLHDVEARHGYGAALLEGLALAGGAVAGGLATASPFGAVLGAETAAGLMGQVAYKDSWERTSDGNTYVDPHTHQPVSLGRDIADVIGLKPGTTIFKLASGTVDGIGDLEVGGTEVLGLVSKAQDLTGLGGVLGHYWGGTGAATSEDVARAYSQYGSVRRAFRELAGMSSGDIALNNAYLSIARNAPLRDAIGAAQTPDEVAQVFTDAVRSNEMAFSGQLPTMTITRLPFHAMYQALKQSDLPVVGRFAQRITNLPDAWDDVAKALSSVSWDPSSRLDDGTVAIARIARMTENERVAANIASEYANTPDLGIKVGMYRNLVLSTIFNLAGFRGLTEADVLAKFATDPAVQQKMADALDRTLAGGMFGKDAIYGLDDTGEDLSKVWSADGKWRYSMAITKNQTGKLAMVDLAEVRRAAKVLADERNWIGKSDQFLFDHVTAPIFKPLALLTPSYALHIALAELIPNVLRLGFLNTLRSTMQLYSARTGLKFFEDEHLAVAGVAGRLVRGSGEAMSEQNLNEAAQYIIDRNMHLGPVATRSGHGAQEQAEQTLREMASRSPKLSSKEFTLYTRDSKQHVPAWQAWLHEGANDDATQVAASKLVEGAAAGKSLDDATADAARAAADWWRIQPEAEQARFFRSSPNFTAYENILDRPVGQDHIDEWGRVIAQNLRGMTRGADGTLHIPLLDHIRNGETVPDSELEGIPLTARPAVVKGRAVVPRGDSTMQRLVEMGFRGVLNPMVDFLSRYPLTFTEYRKQLAFLQPAVDKGIMDAEMARDLATQRASFQMIRNIHNLTDRTQWTVTFRNWAPFYFAQEQAYRRFGRLLGESPRAFRQYQLMITNMHNVGQVFSGKDGQGYLVMPGTGFLTAGVARAAAMLGLPVEGATPVGMGWNLSASSVIFPLSAGFRPDIGPLVSIPVTSIASIFPETLSPVLKADFSAAASTVLGPGASDSWYSQLVPNTVLQRFLTATGALNQRSFNSTMMQTLATLDFEGKLPPPTASYQQVQEFVDRVRNQTRLMYVMKAIVGAVTPVSPEVTNPIYNQFTADLAADIQKHGSVAAGVQAFLHAHPDATPFTVFQSENLTGATLPDSVGAESWINEHYSLITRYPSAALLLMPMTVGTKYNAAVYNEQIAQSLRVKLAPGEPQEIGNAHVPSYIDQLYIAAGNSIVLDKWLPQFEAQTKGMAGEQKYQAEQAFYGNGQIGSGTLGKYGQTNPTWWTWWTSNERATQRALAVKQMQTLLASGEAPRGAMADDARALLEGYANHENALAGAGQISTQITQENDRWKAYLVNLVTEQPDLTNLVNGLFLSTNAPTATVASPLGAQPGVYSAQSWNKAA